MAGWIVSILTYFGVRHKLGEEKSVAQVLKIKPIQLGIVVITIAIWYLVIPLRSLTIQVQDFDSGAVLPGATVQVDKEKAPRPAMSNEKGEIKIRGLRAVPLDLRFERDGYQTKTVTTSFLDALSYSNTSKVSLQKSQGSLLVNTIPEGAKIFLDGNNERPVGLTPKRITLTAGKHTIKFTSAGYHPTSWEEISIAAHDNLPLERRLKQIPPETYPVIVSSEPQGADIYIGNQPKGKTPTTLRLPAGEHSFEIRKPGYKPARDLVKVPDRDIITFDLEQDSIK